MENEDLQGERPLSLQQGLKSPENSNRPFVRRALQETVKALFPIVTSDMEFAERREHKLSTLDPETADQYRVRLHYHTLEGAVVELTRFALLGATLMKEGHSDLIVMAYLSPTIIHLLSKMPPEGKFGIAMKAVRKANIKFFHKA